MSSRASPIRGSRRRLACSASPAQTTSWPSRTKPCEPTPSTDGPWVVEEVGGQPVAVFWKAGTSSALDAPEIAEGRDVGAIAAYRPVVAGRTLTFGVREEGIVDRETGSVWSILGRAMSGPLAGEQLVPELAIDSFWFDWAAFHPETRIFGQP